MNTIPFSQVPLSVFTDRGLSASAKVAYGYILSRTNKEGYCWASTETIANDLGCSSRKIQKDLRELQEADYIKRFYTEGGRKIYPQVTIKGDTQPQHRKDVKTYKGLPKNNTAKTKPLPKHMHSRSPNNITSSSKEEEVIIPYNNSSYVVSSSLQEETPKANSAAVYGTEHFQEAYRFSKKDYEGTIFGVKWGGKMPQEKMTEMDFVSWATSVQNFILEKVS
jgi:DNA-binding Lrp family transcriptional regulator